MIETKYKVNSEPFFGLSVCHCNGIDRFERWALGAIKIEYDSTEPHLQNASLYNLQYFLIGLPVFVFVFFSMSSLSRAVIYKYVTNIFVSDCFRTWI